MLAFYGVTAIDLQASDVCRKDRPKTPRTQEFCKLYEDLKSREYEITNKGRKLGVRLGKKMLHTFDFRSDEYLWLMVRGCRFIGNLRSARFISKACRSSAGHFT
jgi:hypothetical protein